MFRDTLVCRLNLQVCRETYGDTPRLHYISGLVCRARKSLRTTGLTEYAPRGKQLDGNILGKFFKE